MHKFIGFSFVSLIFFSSVFAGVPNNSVGSLKLKDQSVGPNKLKDQAVISSKIKDGAITGNKIAVGTLEITHFSNPEELNGDKGDKGDQGEKGDKGDKGDQGEKGDKGDSANLYSWKAVSIGDCPFCLVENTEVQKICMDDSNNIVDDSKCLGLDEPFQPKKKWQYGNASVYQGISDCIGGSITANIRRRTSESGDRYEYRMRYFFYFSDGHRKQGVTDWSDQQLSVKYDYRDNTRWLSFAPGAGLSTNTRFMKGDCKGENNPALGFELFNISPSAWIYTHN